MSLDEAVEELGTSQRRRPSHARMFEETLRFTLPTRRPVSRKPLSPPGQRKTVPAPAKRRFVPKPTMTAPLRERKHGTLTKRWLSRRPFDAAGAP